MRLVLTGALVTSIALAPASTFAVDYLSAEQAARLMFPDANAVVPRAVDLSATQLQQLDAPPTPPRRQFHAARAGLKRHRGTK